MTTFAFWFARFLVSKRAVVVQSSFLLIVIVLCKSLRFHFIDFLKQVWENLLNVYVFSRRAFIKDEFVLFCKLLGFFNRDFSFRWILLDEIEFVSNQNDDNVWFCMIFQLSEPFLDMREGLFLCYIIDNQSSNRLAVMASVLNDLTLRWLLWIIQYLQYPIFKL